MGKKMNPLFIFLVGAIFSSIIANPVKDKKALLDFLEHIHHSRSLNWSKEASVCNDWIGVTCNSDRSRVIALRLPDVGLRGPIPFNTLGRLSAVEILSLGSNAISGPFPSDFAELKNLTDLDLHFNKLSGPLPDFSIWNNLTILNLSNNGFNGSIPPSVLKLRHLIDLNLSNNSLSGDVPDLNIPSLQQLDLANNNLTGIVPKPLERFPSWAFLGNNLSENAHTPAPAGLPPNSQAQPPQKAKKIREPALLGIVIGGCVMLFTLVALWIICCQSKRQKEQEFPANSQKNVIFLKKKASENQYENNGLVFFEVCNLAFDWEDLLRASAEVLGKGTFGVTYKAALEDATTTVAVKRLKEVTSARWEFELQMDVIGRIRHENVSALWAYYYSKDEKLVVHDYYDLGSVSALLHGKRGDGWTPLDWETRLKIAIGAARGIAHIHSQNSGKLVHGNIKATNIFLNSQGYGCVSDVGLAAVMSPTLPPVTRAAGYRAPEVNNTRKATQASDVYSFGVLLLELLTGKSPIHAAGGEEIVHLVRWVHSTVREEWTAEVFDLKLLQYPNIEEEMVEMLQIGMSCVARTPEQRPKMSELVKMVEEVRPANMESQLCSETKSGTSASTPIPHAAEIGSSSSLSQ